MALYKIENDICLGWSHSGGVNIESEGFVELSEEEVMKIVELIRKTETSDIKKLRLKKLYPGIYEKLRKAYFEIAYNAQMLHWLWDGYHLEEYKYDKDELMSYCTENCGFDGEFDDFDSWLEYYLSELDDEEAIDFFLEHMNAELELDDDEIAYEVAIPEAVIKMAEKKE